MNPDYSDRVHVTNETERNEPGGKLALTQRRYPIADRLNPTFRQSRGGLALPLVNLRHGALWLGMVLMIVAGCLDATADANTFLRAKGHDIVDERGERVLLRGVGLGNWMLPEGYMWKFGRNGDRPRRIEQLIRELLGADEADGFWAGFRKDYVTERDIERIGALGFNSVRPALNSRLFLTESDPPQLRDEGFLLLDNLVTWCRAHGLYVIIDMHGAPGGQTGQNIDDSINDEPRLFMETKYQDQLVMLWEAIARRYRDEPTVAGYDLLNEPLPARTGALDRHRAQLEPLYQRITRAIRKIDSRHMIILEGADWSNDWSVFTKPFDPNLVYQFHYYCWDNPTRVHDISRFLDYRRRFDVPVWVGETGERDGAIYWATTEYFEANNIGWSFWPWKKMDTRNTPYSIRRPAGWDAIAAYSDGGPKPDAELAKRAFAELLENIRLENCEFFPDVVNAMLRQAPVRLEAENYGREGLNRSYFVTNPRSLSKFYRPNEPVPIEQVSTGRRSSDQAIRLTEKEWTAYQITSRAADRYQLVTRVRAVREPARVELRVGSELFTLDATNRAWTEWSPGVVRLEAGNNRVVWKVTRGSADLDWIQFDQAPATGETVTAEAANVLH